MKEKILPYPSKKVGEINMRLYTKEQVDEMKKCWLDACKEPHKVGLYTTEQVSKKVGIACDTIRKYEGKLFPNPSKVLDGKRGRLFTMEQIELIKKRWKTRTLKAQNELITHYNKFGYYTVAQVSKILGIGQTTIRRYEGKLFPMAKRVGRNKLRLFLNSQVELINKKWKEKCLNKT